MSIFRSRRFWKRSSVLLATSGLLLIPAFKYARVLGSDHADTVENVQRPGADLTDVYMFLNPTDPTRVALVMDVNPLIPAGQGTNRTFDPNVLYQFKIDNTGDFVEDLVIQATFGTPTDNQQTVKIAGPVKPTRLGTVNVAEIAFSTTGFINQTFQPNPGMQVFAGGRADPFFFDLNRFLQILPDRGVPAGLTQPPPPGQENTPQQAAFNNPGNDFLANLNVLSIVVELPKALLGAGRINLWETTSVKQ